jgi:predicted histidine transporter YuiF (NhaC family)
VNGLPLQLTAAAVAMLLGCLVAFVVGYRADRRQQARDMAASKSRHPAYRRTEQ